MTKQEFKERVDELFSEYKTNFIFTDTPNNFAITNNITLVFGYVAYGLLNENNQVIYNSGYINDLEKSLDDLIIFKELTLPKYL